MKRNMAHRAGEDNRIRWALLVAGIVFGLIVGWTTAPWGMFAK